MPLCFFSYQNMIELKLSNCLVKPPTKSKRFRTLKRVTFWGVTLAQDVLENLICWSPLLESLEMKNCTGFTHLKIDAPNLRVLSFTGGFEDVSLQNTLKLTVVCINLSVNNREDFDSSSNLAKFFTDLPHIQRLTLDGLAVELLAVGDLPGRLPKPCLDLSSLHLTVYFNDLDEILTTLYLLRSSPALEELNVKVYHENEEEDEIDIDEDANSWLDNLDEEKNFSFANLQLVQITQFSCRKAELDFIKYLLLNSPVLERMTIWASSADRSSEILKKLLQLRRSSSAEIIYFDP